MLSLLYEGCLVGNIRNIDVLGFTNSDGYFTEINLRLVHDQSFLDAYCRNLDEGDELVGVRLVGVLEVQWYEPLVVLRVTRTAVIELLQLSAELSEFRVVVEVLLNQEPLSGLLLGFLSLQLLLPLFLLLKLLLLLLGEFLGGSGCLRVFLGILGRGEKNK